MSMRWHERPTWPGPTWQAAPRTPLMPRATASASSSRRPEVSFPGKWQPSFPVFPELRLLIAECILIHAEMVHCLKYNFPFVLFIQWLGEKSISVLSKSPMFMYMYTYKCVIGRWGRDVRYRKCIYPITVLLQDILTTFGTRIKDNILDFNNPF